MIWFFGIVLFTITVIAWKRRGKRLQAAMLPLMPEAPATLDAASLLGAFARATQLERAARKINFLAFFTTALVTGGITLIVTVFVDGIYPSMVVATVLLILTSWLIHMMFKKHAGGLLEGAL